MNFEVLTLFPEIVESYFETSIMARAVDRGIIQYSLHKIRHYAVDKHRTCDDTPYGGGAGMVLKPEPIARTIDQNGLKDIRTVYMTPSGKLFNQVFAKELAKEDSLVILCGRYEGVDQRVIDHYVDDEVSIGDYVISSGEIAALVLIDAVYRLCEGVITPESLNEESFTSGLLEYPHYTRPEIFEGIPVPDVLLSGHHEQIRLWRKKMSLEKTGKVRPELLEHLDGNGNAQTDTTM